MRSVYWARVLGALEGADSEGPPVSLWKHYHLQDRAPRRLAETTVEFAQRFDIDLIKLTPSGLYGVQDWGVGLQFGVSDEDAPFVISSPISRISDWGSLNPLSPELGALGRELELCGHVSRLLDGERPFMMTIFSPLTLAQKIAGDSVYEHLREDPAEMHKALGVIRDTVVDYARACLQAGVPGFFLATQQASRQVLNEAEFREFGLAYDQDVASAIREAPIRMLHVCGEDIMFESASQLDVNCLSWSAGGSNPDVDEAGRMTGKALAAGLSLDTLAEGSPRECADMVRGVLESDVTQGLILAPDCVVKLHSPDVNLEAVIAAARA